MNKNNNNPFSIKNLAETIDKIAEAVNKRSDSGTPLKTMAQINQEAAERERGVVK